MIFNFKSKLYTVLEKHYEIEKNLDLRNMENCGRIMCK